MEKITVESSTIQENHQQQQQNSPTNYNKNRNRCCFSFPCFGPDPGPKPHFTLGSVGGSSSAISSSSSSLWDRFRVGETENKWWASPIKAFKKIREWSEIVAGPKWKTFIRTFNRNSRQQRGHHHHGNNVSPGKFQYDPLSYALNFDEGQNGHFDDEGFVVEENFPDFSSRFASSARSSVDFGKAGLPPAAGR